MVFKVGIVQHYDDTVNIFFHDESGTLRRKVWVYPDGSITYCDFDRKGRPYKHFRLNKTVLEGFEDE